MTTGNENIKPNPIVHTAEVAPPRTTCARAGCISPASVRLGHTNGTSRDLCGLDYGTERERITGDPEHPGKVTDTTGTLADLKAEFPDWSFTFAVGGRLHACDGTTTVSAFLSGPLRAEILRTIESWALGTL